MAQSVFPQEIDSFSTHYDPTAEIMPKVARYEQLRAIVNKTPTQEEEFEQLAVELAPYIFTTEELNTIQEAMVNLEIYFRDHTIPQLEEWDADISNQIEQWRKTLSQEISDTEAWVEARVDRFSYKKSYDPETTYLKDNIVLFNYALYILTAEEAIGIEPTNTEYWDVYMPNKKGEKGDKGDPGMNLAFRGMWVPGFEYKSEETTGGNADMVSYGHRVFVCLENHTSGETFDSTKWLCVIDSDNFDLEAVALKMNCSYRSSMQDQEDGTMIINEKILESINTDDPFNTESDGRVLIECVSTITGDGIADTIESVYTDNINLLGFGNTYTFITKLNGDSSVSYRVLPPESDPYA